MAFLRSLSASALLLAAACGEGVAGPGQTRIDLPRALSQTEVQLVDASNDFAFRLLAQVSDDSPNAENLFLSPLSASMALGMTMNGTAGSTLEGLRSGLGFGSMPLEEINAGYATLIDLLDGLDPRVQLDLANAVFYRDGFAVETSFLEAVGTHFDAAVEALDFSSPAAPTRINDWVADQTSGRITDMVEPPIDPETMMFLLNAIYFQGTWTWEFDPEKTALAPFFARGGEESVLFMDQEVTVPYAETSDFKAVDLPYGGQAFAMTVLVPREGGEISDIVAALDERAWLDLLGSMGELEGTVRMPRFQLEYEVVLNGALRALGMQDAFDPAAADFTPMYRAARSVQLHIAAAKQKTFVAVDEEGTEAAAVTSVEVGVTCACPTGFQLVADRPFLFAIRERLTGAILFVGVMHDPTA